MTVRRDTLKKYRLRQSDYDRILESQGKVCAICERPTSDGRALAVDHDHKTGAIRGLLCFHCNGGLGQFGDDIDRMKRAIAYLEAAEAMFSDNCKLCMDTTDLTPEDRYQGFRPARWVDEQPDSGVVTAEYECERGHEWSTRWASTLAAVRVE